MKVYFDNASTTPLHREVIDTMTAILENNFGNPSSIHSHGRISKAIVEGARKQIASILNTSIGEIFFTSCATEANNMILKMAVAHLGIRKIIYTPLEHHCVFHSIDHLVKEHDVETVILPIDADGSLDYDFLEKELQSTIVPCLVTVMHGNNEIGVMNDIKKIGEICRDHQAYFHSDIVQTIGKFPLDLQEINVHFACGSAHKFHGPKGVGFAYIRNDAIIPPFLHGGSQERNMRAGTENVYGIAGMSKALEVSVRNMETWKTKISALKHYFIEQVKNKINDIELNGQLAGLYHVASISFPPTSKSDLLMFNLDIAGISCSSGSACSSGIESSSHVLQAINHDPNRKTIRFSFSHLNTKEEVDYVVEKLREIV